MSLALLSHSRTKPLRFFRSTISIVLKVSIAQRFYHFHPKIYRCTFSHIDQVQGAVRKLSLTVSIPASVLPSPERVLPPVQLRFCTATSYDQHVQWKSAIRMLLEREKLRRAWRRPHGSCRPRLTLAITSTWRLRCLPKVVYQTNIGHRICRRQDSTLVRMSNAGLPPKDLLGSGTRDTSRRHADTRDRDLACDSCLGRSRFAGESS